MAKTNTKKNSGMSKSPPPKDIPFRSITTAFGFFFFRKPQTREQIDDRANKGKKKKFSSQQPPPSTPAQRAVRLRHPSTPTSPSRRSSPRRSP